MHTYIVTCKMPNGSVVERRVKARDHVAAQRKLRGEGLTDIVIVDRETRADRQMDRTTKGVIFSLVIGIIAAVIAIWWFRHAFARFFN